MACGAEDLVIRQRGTEIAELTSLLTTHTNGFGGFWGPGGSVVAGSCKFKLCAVGEGGEWPWPCSSSSPSMPHEQVADTSFDLHRNDTGPTSTSEEWQPRAPAGCTVVSSSASGSIQIQRLLLIGRWISSREGCLLFGLTTREICKSLPLVAPSFETQTAGIQTKSFACQDAPL